MDSQLQFHRDIFFRAKFLQNTLNSRYHDVGTADVELLVKIVDLFFQIFFVNSMVIVAGYFFLCNCIDEIVPQHGSKFIPQNNVAVGSVGKYEFIVANPFLLLKLSKDCDERRDSGTTRNKRTLLCIVNGSPHVVLVLAQPLDFDLAIGAEVVAEGEVDVLRVVAGRHARAVAALVILAGHEVVDARHETLEVRLFRS